MSEKILKIPEGEMLERCPFCGGEAEIIYLNPCYRIHCKKWTCDAQMAKFSSLKRAIRFWNSRV